MRNILHFSLVIRQFGNHIFCDKYLQQVILFYTDICDAYVQNFIILESSGPGMSQDLHVITFNPITFLQCIFKILIRDTLHNFKKF